MPQIEDKTKKILDEILQMSATFDATKTAKDMLIKDLGTNVPEDLINRLVVMLRNAWVFGRTSAIRDLQANEDSFTEEEIMMDLTTIIKGK